MKYILINIIVFSYLLEASQAFLYIQPISIEYTDIDNKKIAPKIIEKNNTQDIEDDNIQQMWANPTDEPFQENDDLTTQTEEQKETNHIVCNESPTNFTIDKYGCPQEYLLKTKFKNKSFTIVHGMKQELQEFAKFLKKHNSYQVLIYSYTDSIGTEAENRSLTQKRAETITKILIDLGVSSTKLTAIGKGEQDPLESNVYKKGRDKNNRVEIELIY